MEWNLNEEPETEDVSEVEAKVESTKDRYVAVIGLSFDGLNLRINPGDELPPYTLEDEFIFDWLLNKKKAIKKI